MNLFSCLARPALFMLDPERAHSLAIAGLKPNLLSGSPLKDKRLEQNIAGLDFPNIIGLAAGFDKNGEAIDALFSLGFGFVEIGTITPKPQSGNEKPRLFRLVKDEAVINRMGFNNDGHDVVLKRLEARNNNDKKAGGILGVNIGANKDSENRIADYVLGIGRFYAVADYFTVNISSPNTPGLRDLQGRAQLHELINAVSQARLLEKNKTKRHVPIFLKIAPDLTEEQCDDVAAELLQADFDGVIISNTTLSRKGLTDIQQAQQAGGMSGRPLFEAATIILAKMRQRLGKTMPIIGVGGVHDATTALEKIKAGADLVQMYSAMVYSGPYLGKAIIKDILKIMQDDGVDHISAYRDQNLQDWAKRKIMLD